MDSENVKGIRVEVGEILARKSILERNFPDEVKKILVYLLDHYLRDGAVVLDIIIGGWFGPDGLTSKEIDIFRNGDLVQGLLNVSPSSSNGLFESSVADIWGYNMFYKAYGKGDKIGLHIIVLPNDKSEIRPNNLEVRILTKELMAEINAIEL